MHGRQTTFMDTTILSIENGVSRASLVEREESMSVDMNRIQTFGAPRTSNPFPSSMIPFFSFPLFRCPTTPANHLSHRQPRPRHDERT